MNFDQTPDPSIRLLMARDDMHALSQQTGAARIPHVMYAMAHARQLAALLKAAEVAT